MTLASPYTTPGRYRTPGQCPFCDFRVTGLATSGLPAHNYRRVHRSEVTGQAEEYDAGWCPGGGWPPEPVPEGTP